MSSAFSIFVLFVCLFSNSIRVEEYESVKAWSVRCEEGGEETGKLRVFHIALLNILIIDLTFWLVIVYI